MMFEHVLFLSVYLFSIGIYGLITSRNMVRALICLELILNSINLNLVTFSDLFDSCQLKGDIFAIFIIALAAAEAAIGLSILSSIHHMYTTSLLCFPQFLMYSPILEMILHIRMIGQEYIMFLEHLRPLSLFLCTLNGCCSWIYK